MIGDNFRNVISVALWLTCTMFQAPCAAQSPVNYEERKLSDGVTEYLDRRMGVTFTLGRDWRLAGEGVRWRDPGWNKIGDGDPAATVELRHHSTDEFVGLYYRVSRQVSPMTKDEIDKVLSADVDDKIWQRKDKDGFKNYRIRAHSYEQGEVGGKRALACVADFTSGGKKMVEYLVWVRSETTLAEFFIRCPAD